MSIERPFLLDCTRMVAQRWLGLTPTGIDRVCDAYRAHFASRAQAVVQLRGRARVLDRDQSDSLFAMLEAPHSAFRRRFVGLAAVIGTAGRARADAYGAIYLNVSHTDFDLDRHFDWVQASGVRSVYLVHDLIPIEHPHFTTPHKTRRHAGRVRRALEAASGIIANSHTTARALDAYIRTRGLAPPPILCAPLGAPELPSVHPATARHRQRATFVCVGTIEPRKNHMLLLDIWDRLIARDGEAAPRLTLIGRWGTGSQDVRRRYLADRRLRRFVQVIGDCSDVGIVRHLCSATALLAPSLAEGFGLPVVEALGLGVPVIASDIPAFREVGAGIPTFVNSAATEAWIGRIDEFCANGPERRRQLAALDSYRAPDWRDHFRLVEDWLADLPYAGAVAGLLRAAAGTHAAQGAYRLRAGAMQ
ncbi:glycosyltransferase family 4 protein [Erythrobacter cryptus]|uniref:glycosyltransferase family 4 protein n=1 Tax=Erythrobacter cryptus TaxID=196588 RepID=UPI0004170735|nr:glycosyltransferase family 1 protein [Erythrobacter cryptus]